VVVSVNDPRLLGRGIYDLAEVARLVRRSADEVAGWAVATEDRDALLFPRQDRLLSFYDLVTAHVVAEFRGRGVPLFKLRDARHMLARHFELDWPLAHAAGLRRLASSGSDVYVLLEEWVDAGRGGQRAFQEIVGPLLRHLDFDAESMATTWRPVRGVLLDPAVQAGAPCLEGTRIATELVAELVEAGEDVEDVADDYGVDPALVRAAVEFEHGLAA
jgi:uncharacterized protein (DUF433 family)